MIFTKNKEGVRAIRAMKYKKCVAGKYTRARAPLARKYTNRIFESKDGTTSMKIVNYIERHKERNELLGHPVVMIFFARICNFKKLFLS